MCVVGIFGKDNLGYKSKAVHLNGTIGKEVFKVCLNRGCMFKNTLREVCVVSRSWNVDRRRHIEGFPTALRKIPTYTYLT